MRLLAAILSAGLLAAGAHGAATKNVRPFVYTFHVSSITVGGVAQPVHGGGATVRIHLHSARLPKTEALRWRGVDDFSAGNGEAVAGVPLTGTMVFTDARRPNCNRTMKIAASGTDEVLTMELLYARDPAATPMIQVALANYPVEIDLRLGRQAPRCGYRHRDVASTAEEYPPSVLRRPGFTMKAHTHDRVPGVGSIDWHVTVAVKRVRYVAGP